MLRNIFISLLILSALTSEGILNIPLNIYSLYIDSDRSLTPEAGQDVDLEGIDRDGAGTGLVTDAYLSYLGSEASRKRWELLPADFNSCGNISAPYESKLTNQTCLKMETAFSDYSCDRNEAQGVAVRTSIPSRSNGLILQRTDSSPPYQSV